MLTIQTPMCGRHQGPRSRSFKAFSLVQQLNEVAIMSESFEIEFRGEPGPVVRAAFPEFELRPRHGLTVFHGDFVDQAALHGVIDRINSLGLELVAVHRVDEDLSDAIPPTGSDDSVPPSHS